GDGIGSALNELGNTTEVLSANRSSFADDEMLALVEPLEEYWRMLMGINAALVLRKEKKAQYLYAVGDVEAKVAVYRKVQGATGKEAQAEVKQGAVLVAQRSADVAKVDLESCSARLLIEFQLFQNQKAIDLKEIMFVGLQLQHLAQSEAAWRGLLPALAQVPVRTVEQVRSLVQDGAVSASAIPAHHWNVEAALPTATQVGGMSHKEVAVVEPKEEEKEEEEEGNPFGEDEDEPSAPPPLPPMPVSPAPEFEEEEEDDFEGV
ncbi:hypothetical protein B484DRAFT_396718, partial [Ochromonadaceae sp. CCMP2298]